MAKTPSNMVTLGTKAPKFELHNTVDDILYSSEELFSKNGTVVMFICNHCPFVIHVIDEIVSISENYKENISFVAISSNDVINYPDDSPELMKKFAVIKIFHFHIYLMKLKKLLRVLMQLVHLIFSYTTTKVNLYIEVRWMTQGQEMEFRLQEMI